jgi:IQ motif/SEC7 domain-containing protein
MTEKDFINNLKGSDSGIDFDHKLLKSIYKAIKKQELRSGVDHVMQAALLRTRISGKVPHLAEPHRRLVCLCRLAEVVDINTKKEADANNHYRDIWLFNDMMLVTKVSGKAGSSAVYSYKDSFHLSGLEVTLFRTSVYKYGIQISRKGDSAVLATLAASSEHDQYKFVMDIQESIFEMDVMGHALRDANLIK